MAYCRFTEKCSVYMYKTEDGYHIQLRHEPERYSDMIVKKTALAAKRYLDRLIREGTWDSGNDLNVARNRLKGENDEL